MSRQLALLLEPRAESESALRYAWARSGSRVPYQVAIHVPALAICLRNIAAAEIAAENTPRRRAPGCSRERAGGPAGNRSIR